ncbi:MAG: type VI secretion system baseplate subunit TssE, partial [Candidatus Thiodiazotropha weberae]|nr:type VI secretion system baseplate subunit TssE [Candidatus Thiodiazotropha lotti]MCW4207817.1 type VI secretion system baseplate subunit TssE [Candidatus Thiodiazotropha lotti]
MKASNQQQLQPSLLDRLIDDEPGKTKESQDKR